MNVRRQKQLALLLVGLVVLAPVGYAAAQTLTHSASSGVTYVTNSGVEVTLGDDREVQAVPFDDDNTFNSSSIRISGSNAQVEINNNSFSSDPVPMQNVDVTGSLTVERTDLNRQITVESGDASLLQVADYAVDDGAGDLVYDSNNGVTVTLTGFSPIGIAAVDADTGEPLDDVAVGSDGTATFDLPAGQRTVRLETAPSDLQVRNEANPNELIDGNVSLRARLFANDDVVIERQVVNGKVSLDGVPLDEELVITVKEANADFTYRRILIDSAIETSEIYLLPTTEPSAEVRYQLQDDTGRFDSDETRLFVEKPITRDFNGDGTNTTEYRTISGDRVGADGEFPTILVDSERYRLRVENDAGEQRVLGSYTVQGARISPIPIGEVEFTADVSKGAAMQASLRGAPDGASHNHEIRLVYVDGDAKTDSIDIAVENSSGGAIRPSTTEQISGSEAYVETYPIEDTSFDPEQDTATVTVESFDDGGGDDGSLGTTQRIKIDTYSETVGDVPEIFDNAPVDSDLLELAGLVSIVAVIGLLVIVNPSLAALVGTGYAGLLVLVGVVPIPMRWVVGAGMVSIVAAIGDRRLR